MNKLVSVIGRRPFRLRNKLVRSVNREYLTTEEILNCITQYAVVTEHLDDARNVTLTLSNYDKDINGEIKAKLAAKAKAEHEAAEQAKKAKEEAERKAKNEAIQKAEKEAAEQARAKQATDKKENKK